MPYDITQILWWNFRGGEKIEMDGSNQNANLVPPLAGLIVEIDAINGLVNYQINGVATAASHGVVPENAARIIGPLQNWESLGLFGAAGTDAHLTYYREKIQQ